MNDVIIVGVGPQARPWVVIYLCMHQEHHPGELKPSKASCGRIDGYLFYPCVQGIGFCRSLSASVFVHKYGASWHPPSGKEFAIEFAEFPQEGIDQDYTYHVDRSKLDLLMLKHAEHKGAKVYQGVHVKQVLFEDERPLACRRNSVRRR